MNETHNLIHQFIEKNEFSQTRSFICEARTAVLLQLLGADLLLSQKN